eukprot:s732_g15.t1
MNRSLQNSMFVVVLLLVLLLPNAALLGVAEAEVASARHVFDFQVQLDLFRELESLGRRIEDMSAGMAPGRPDASTERQADLSETFTRQLEAMLASAVREVTSKVSEDFASLRAELRLHREHADPPAESPDMVSKQAFHSSFLDFGICHPRLCHEFPKLPWIFLAW